MGCVTACPITGPSLVDPWTASTPPDTATPSDTSTPSPMATAALTLAPAPNGTSTNGASALGTTPERAPTGATGAGHGSRLADAPAGGTSVVVCKRCGKRPRRDRINAQLCVVCHDHDEARKLCQQCGAEKTNVKRGSHYCVACESIETRPGLPCRGCGGEKTGRGSHYCLACRAARDTCSRCGLRPRRDELGARYCAECKAETEATYEERQAAYKREWVLWHTEREVAPGVNGQRKAQPDARSFPKLPAAPLAAKVEQLIVQERAGLHAFAPPFLNADGKPMQDHVREAVCKRLGITSKCLREWNSGERLTVQFDTADGVLSRSPWLWRDVWGDTNTVCWLTSKGTPVANVFESTELTVEAA